jgi:hypothetical protein
VSRQNGFQALDPIQQAGRSGANTGIKSGLQATRRRPTGVFVKEGLMSSWNKNLTIDQLLNDPVTLAVMEADKVNPDALKAMLRSLAARLKGAAIEIATPKDLATPKNDISGPAGRYAAPPSPFSGTPTLGSLTRFAGAGAPFDRCRAP